LNQSTHANKQPSTSTSAFGSSTQQPSAFASTSTGGHTFGQTSFGQQQQSASGSTVKPTFGGFSAYANAGPSSFAAAAANQNRAPESGGFAAFAGQPSVFGAGAANTTSGFGTGSAFSGGGGGGFGAPAPVFGQPAFAALQNQPANAFGQPQSVVNQPTTHPQSAFGQPQNQAPSVFSALSAQSQFGSSTGVNNPLNNPQPSAFTPLSNPANPLNGAFNPLESLPPQAQPFGAFANGPISSGIKDSTMASPFTPTFSSGTTTAATASSATNPITHPKTRPDFAALLTKVRATPGFTPYDSLLAPEYAKMIPERVVQAFMKDKFEFGQVPEWVPPIEVR